MTKAGKGSLARSASGLVASKYSIEINRNLSFLFLVSSRNFQTSSRQFTNVRFHKKLTKLRSISLRLILDANKLTSPSLLPPSFTSPHRRPPSPIHCKLFDLASPVLNNLQLYLLPLPHPYRRPLTAPSLRPIPKTSEGTLTKDDDSNHEQASTSISFQSHSGCLSNLPTILIHLYQAP